MVNKVIWGLVGLLAFLFVACSPKQSELIVAEYGGHEIKMNEFEKAYSKNVGSYEKAKNDSIKNLERFLDLYVNFKMKLRDDQAISNELKEYEKTIGASYLLENELYNKGIEDLYNKRKDELRVSHLLIRTDSLSDEQAYQKALEIIKRINNGASFEDEVLANSDDQFSKKNGGDIYYITAGTVMPEFEDMAYNTPVGTVNPKPLKTKYGYHIIKVTARNKRTPQIRASHILIRKETPEEKTEGKSKLDLANEIIERARKGEDFGKLALEYSEDPGSQTKNGDLGFFSRRQLVQPFDEAAFNLKVGEISDVVESQFGYHIIKLTDRQEYPSLESERKSLRDLYERTRKKIDYDALIAKYSKELNLVMHDDVFKNIVSNSVDLKIDKDYWGSDFQKNYGNKVLFTIGANKFTTDSLFAFALKDSKNLGKMADESKLTEVMTNLKNEKLIEIKAGNLVNDDPEFASLMKEYQDGIFIFRLQEDEVWNKMKMDSSDIYKYYEDTKDSYVWPDRVQYNELSANTDSLAQKYYKMLEDGANFDSLVVKYNKNIKNRKENELSGLIDANTNSLSKAANTLEKEGDFSGVVKNTNGAWSIVKLIKKDPSHLKTFDEARTEVTSRFQDVESAQLENQYVSRLRKIYNPKLFYEELKNAYKN